MQYTSNFDLSIVIELAEIASKINLTEIVTPVNATEEKERWIGSVIKYEFFPFPSFRYDRQLLQDVASKRQRLENMKYHLLINMKAENAVDELIVNLLEKRIDELEKTAEIAASILGGDDLQTAKLSTEIYGCPSTVQVIRCYDVAKNNNIKSYLNGDPLPGPRFLKGDQKKLKAMKFNANGISHWFSEVLDYYGVDGWTVDIDDKYTAINVRDRNSSGYPTIGIPTSRNVDGLKLLELIGHEIECHLRSNENSRALFASLLGEQSPLTPLIPLLAKNSNELLSEGQAKVSDVSVNGAMAIPAPFYSIAANQARHDQNFNDVGHTIFDMLTGNMMSWKEAAEKAWTYTYRVFRGSTEPNERNKYCFSKDYCYESGWFIAREIDPIYLEYASLSLDEIKALIKSGVDISNPKYRNLDAVGWVKDRLFNKTT